MPIIITIKVYQWLRKLGIIKQEPIGLNKANKTVSLSSDDENYFRNGYSVGAVLRKYSKPHSEKYVKLLGVRKIAGLMSSQNWAILQPELKEIGCEELENLQQNDQEQENFITENIISNILQFLFQKFCPEEVLASPGKHAKKKVTLDFNHFHKGIQLEHAQNSLQFICLALAQSFDIEIGQSLGLLLDNSKNLKCLMSHGSRKDDFQSVTKFLDLMIEYWPYLQKQVCGFSDLEVGYILQGISFGLKSEREEVEEKTLEVLRQVANKKWFENKGNMRLLSSPWIQSFNFLMERQKSHLSSIFNENLHLRVKNKIELIHILTNLIIKLPQSIFCKEILTYVSIPYLYERCFQILSPEEIGNYPPLLVSLTFQLLTRLISTFPEKVPKSSLEPLMEIFGYRGNRDYSKQTQLISMLFQIVENLLQIESPNSIAFFKLIMKYLQNTFGEIRHWIILNLKSLFLKKKRSFPLGCFILMYSVNTVGQPTEYQLFQLISDYQWTSSNQISSITETEAAHFLTILNSYYTKQLHCKCFINLISKFIHKNTDISLKWIKQNYECTMEKVERMDIPMLSETSILNPPPPSKNKVVNSIGLKRKQMLKYQDYEQSENILRFYVTVKNRAFLQKYGEHLKNEAFKLSKAIGVKKNIVIKLYKKLAKEALKNAKTVFDTPKMNQLIESIVNHRITQSMSEFDSKEESQSKYFKNSYLPIREQEQKIEQMRFQNQFFQKTSQLQANFSEKQDANSFLIQEEDQNQFMSEPYSQRDQQEISPQNYLLPFSQQQSAVYPVYLTDDLLEQSEISYIKMMKDKYSKLISRCTQIYEILLNKSSGEEVGQELIDVLGISSNVEMGEAESIYLKAKLRKTSDRQIVEQYLVQLGLHIFGFLKTKRIPVTCLSSFFLMLEDRMKEKELSIQQNQSKVIPKMHLKKDVDFRYELQQKILKSHPENQSYFLCFSLLSDILKSGLQVGQIEPISKVVSKFQIPVSKQEKQAAEQLQNLQKMLEDSKQEQQLVIPNSSIKSVNYGGNNSKNPSIFKKKESSTPIEINKVYSEKTLDSSLLKNKLHQRRKLLEAEIRSKNSKNLVVLNTQKTNGENENIE